MIIHRLTLQCDQVPYYIMCCSVLSNYVTVNARITLNLVSVMQGLPPEGTTPSREEN